MCSISFSVLIYYFRKQFSTRNWSCHFQNARIAAELQMPSRFLRPMKPVETSRIFLKNRSHAVWHNAFFFPCDEQHQTPALAAQAVQHHSVLPSHRGGVTHLWVLSLKQVTPALEQRLELLLFLALSLLSCFVCRSSRECRRSSLAALNSAKRCWCAALISWAIDLRSGSDEIVPEQGDGAVARVRGRVERWRLFLDCILYLGLRSTILSEILRYR